MTVIIVNWFLVSVRLSSHGCMPAVVKHERSVRVLTNFPSHNSTDSHKPGADCFITYINFYKHFTVSFRVVMCYNAVFPNKHLEEKK